MDDIQGEDQRDLQPGRHGGILRQFEVRHPDQTEDRADQTGLGVRQQLGSRGAIGSVGAGHLELTELLGQGHLGQQRVDLLIDTPLR